MKVIVVENGDYEQRAVYGVAASHAAAVKLCHEFYLDPHYKVTWDEPTETGIGYHHKAVIHYAIEHDGHFDFTEWDLVE